MSRKEASQAGDNPKLSETVDGKVTQESSAEAVIANNSGMNRVGGNKPKKNGGWQAIEALREKAALKASLADVWDEDFDLDDEILAEMDHTAEFFTSENDDESDILDEEDSDDDFFEEDEI
jgi:hypothetical protein